MPDNPNLTPDEIQSLIDNGGLSHEEYHKLHPDEQKIYLRLDVESSKMMNLMPGGGGGLQAIGEIAPEVGAAGLGALKKGWNAVAGPATGAAGAIAGKAVAGWPGMYAGWKGGNALGAKMQFAEGAGAVALPSKMELLTNPAKYGHLTGPQIQEILGGNKIPQAGPPPTPVGPRQPAGDPPNLQRGGPATMGRASRQPGTFGVPEVNDAPIDWHNVEKSPGGTGRRPIGDPHTMDEADKRKIMFGGVGEGTRPQLRSPGSMPKPGKFDGANAPDPQLEDLLNRTGGSYVNSEFAPKGGSPAEPKAPSRKPTKRRSPK